MGERDERAEDDVPPHPNPPPRGGKDMKIGAAIFPTDRGIHPAELARELEARGFESIWLPEHTHIPVSRRTPYPGGGELPDYYARALDPFVALGAAATATTRLLLGTGVCLVVERDP